MVNLFLRTDLDTGHCRSRMPCPMSPDHNHGCGVQFAVLQQQLLPVTFEFFGQPLKENEFLIDTDGTSALNDRIFIFLVFLLRSSTR
jgi:hypothetical protein